MRRRLQCLDDGGAVVDTVEVSSDLERVYLYGASMSIESFLEAFGPVAERRDKPTDEPYNFWSLGYDPILAREVAEGHARYEVESGPYDGLANLEL